MTEEKKQNKPVEKAKEQKQNQPGEKPQEKKQERAPSKRRRPSNRRRKKPPVQNDDKKQKEQGTQGKPNSQQPSQKKDLSKDSRNRHQSKSSDERNAKQKDQHGSRPASKKNQSSNRGKRRDPHGSDRRDKYKKPTPIFKKAKPAREGQIRQVIFKKNNTAYFSKTGEKDVRLELMDQVEPHVLYRGNNRKYYVATEYSGILHVIVKYDEYEEAKEELRIRGEHDFSHILEFEVESNID